MELILGKTEREIISAGKIFWLMVVFEVVVMAMLMFGSFEAKLWFAGLLLVPLFIVLIPLEPSIGLVVMIVTTGLDFLGTIASDPSVNYYRLTYFHLALVLTFISSFTHAFLQRRTIVPSLDIWPPLTVFLVMYAISLIHTPNVEGALNVFARVVALSGVVFMIVYDVDRPWKTVLIVSTLVLAPLGVSIVTLYQLFGEGTFYAPIVIKVATALGMPVYRSTGTFMNPNSLACFLMVGSVMSFALMFVKTKYKILKWILLGIVLVINLALISSFSRGGWVSTFMAISLIVVFHKKWSYFGYFFLILLVCIFIVSVKFPRLWEVVFERIGTIFQSDGDASSSARIALVKTCIWMWMDYPIFGVGLRGFPFHYPDYIDPTMPQILANVREAHTIQTEILAEFGLVGLVIATWLFVTVFFSGLRKIRKMKNEWLRCMEIGLVSLFIGFIVNFTFATDITNNIFWITIGLMYAFPLIDEHFYGGDRASETAAPAPSA